MLHIYIYIHKPSNLKAFGAHWGPSPDPPTAYGVLQASYFHEIRGQSPYTLNELKVRSRQSEERIVDLAGALAEWQVMFPKDGTRTGRTPGR